MLAIFPASSGLENMTTSTVILYVVLALECEKMNATIVREKKVELELKCGVEAAHQGPHLPSVSPRRLVQNSSILQA